MSALGHKPTYAPQQAMPALPPIATMKADIRERSCLLSLRKRTCAVRQAMSALGQKRTLVSHRAARFPQMRSAPLQMLWVPPARQTKSSPKEHRAKRRREPSRWTVVGWTPQDANCPNAKRHPNAKTSKQKNIFPYCHRASKVHGHDLGSCLRRESGVGDRHGRAPRVGQCFNLGIELM